MISWCLDPANPRIRPGQLHGRLDARRAGAAHVVRRNDHFRMVYWGTDTDGRHHILAAAAPVERPNDWTPLGPLVGAQPETEHNTVGPSFPFLLPIDERRWHLYFCGWGRPGSKRLPNTTGLAISEDGGEHWRYHPRNPILALDQPYDREGTGSLWVLRAAGRFRMYYTAIGRFFARPAGAATGHGDMIPEIGIAYAESADGIEWTKPLPDRVINPRHGAVDPYEYICSKPSLLVDETGGAPRYTMWVNTFGTAYRVHRLTSADGLRWEWAERLGPDGELGVGAPGAFDDQQRSYPVVVQEGDRLHCWFTGNRFGTHGMGYASQRVFGNRC